MLTHKRYRVLAITVLVMASACLMPESSMATHNQFGAFLASNEQELIGEQRAASIVKEHFGGRVLKVQFVSDNGGAAYRVKILNESGRVKSVLVDARSGELR